MRVRPILVLAALVICASPAGAQSLSRYRDYALTSGVSSVLKISGGRESDVTTTREHPAVLREMEWRTPYAMASALLPADPVHDIVFRFYDDQLYSVVVTYTRERVVGLTDADFIESLSKTYGPAAQPATARGPTANNGMADRTTVARWEDANSRLTLTRGAYSGEFQVVLISKALNDSATAAIKAGALLDAKSAPQRAVDLQKREAAEDQKIRDTNKAVFRP